MYHTLINLKNFARLWNRKSIHQDLKTKNAAKLLTLNFQFNNFPYRRPDIIWQNEQTTHMLKEDVEI